MLRCDLRAGVAHTQDSMVLGATSPSGIVCSALPFDLIQLLHILFREIGKEAKLAQLGEHDRILLLSDRLVPLVAVHRERVASCRVGEPVVETVLSSVGGPLYAPVPPARRGPAARTSRQVIAGHAPGRASCRCDG